MTDFYQTILSLLLDFPRKAGLSIVQNDNISADLTTYRKDLCNAYKVLNSDPDLFTNRCALQSFKSIGQNVGDIDPSKLSKQGNRSILIGELEHWASHFKTL